MLLQDPVLAAQIRQAVVNVQQATTDLAQLSNKANGLLTDVQSRQFPQKIDDTMSVVKSAVSNVDASTKQIRDTIAEASQPDANGLTLGSNLRDSISNASTAASNMADGTEALKHNFLLRGFFNRRGYYDLSRIPADKYRQTHAFTSPKNYRAWISAGNLFQRKSNGDEEISVHGKEVLADGLAKYGESVVASPIVIEGYSREGDQASQIAQSRSRSIMVRQFLQLHYQLNPGNVGAVSLSSTPPAGVGHQPWDGICIVILRSKD